jgi:hypothetical protein
MSWVWALATVSKGQLDNTSCRRRVWCVPALSQRFTGAGERPFPVCSGASGCSGLVSDDVSCFPSTLPIVGNVSSP